MHIITGLHDPRDNPATVLHDEWKRTLEAMHGTLDPARPTQAMFYGLDSGFGIGVTKEQDALSGEAGIGWGYVGGNANYFHPYIVILPSGQFRTTNQLHGWQQRDRLARNTFLKWGYAASEYYWRVSEGEGSYALLDYNTPFHYVGEKTLAMRPYGNGGSAWLRLERQGQEWTLQFARAATLQGRSEVDANTFAKFDRLRERRYRTLERRHLIQTGQIEPPPSRKKALSEDEREQRFEEAAAILAKRMPTTIRTATPMKKKEDA